ncbi:MAG: hypothetical protein N4A50_06265 [Vallitalea sp.]|jgi:hypothetical protein|nr:hypothetical protein [Vallitalea sp.]
MNYAIKDATNVQLLRRKADGTKVPVLFTDYANSTTLEFGADRVMATAKGVNKVAFDSNKNGTFSMELQVFELKWLSILLGATEDDNSASEIAKREVLTVSGNKVTLNQAPKAGSIAVFTLDADNRSHKDEVKPGALKDKDLTVTAADDTKIVVYYMVEQSGSKSFLVSNDKYADAYAIYGDTMLRSEMGTDQFVQLRIPNCRPQGAFSISFSSKDVATLSAKFDILADENGDMAEFTYIK